MLEAYRDRFHYILVDEYQDTNASQYDWLKLLAEPRRNLCCVGDDDQSIYSWRGAEVANILRFETRLPRRGGHPARAELPLDPAHPRRRHRPHRPQRRPPRQDAVDRASTRATGSRSSACGTGPRKRAASARRSRRTSAAAARSTTAAILVRAQFQTREFEERFIAIGLAYQIVGGFRFYERAEIRDALAYLRLIAQPADDLAFERIVNRPSAASATRRSRNIHAFARATQQPLLLAAAQMLDSDELHPAGPPQPRPLRRRHRPLAARWRRELPHPELARILLDESGYTAMLQAERSAEAAGRLENLAELARAMEEYETPRRLPRACQPGDGQ